MKKQNSLRIWVKRAIPALALAGTAGLTLPSCEKEPKEEPYREPYEKVLMFNEYNADSILTPVVKKYAKDRACTTIYLTPDSNSSFNTGASFLHGYRTKLLQPALDVSTKVTGRGSIYIYQNSRGMYI